jgi:hypothetical protein
VIVCVYVCILWASSGLVVTKLAGAGVDFGLVMKGIDYVL